jgi:hypothetical protein
MKVGLYQTLAHENHRDSSTFAGAGVTIASSSSSEEMARFLPLDAGGGVALAFAGDFADAAPESDDGSGRAEDGASMVP